MSVGIKHDQNKPKFDLIPYECLEEVTQVLEFGANLYGMNNWKNGLSVRRLLAAALRHIYAFLRGEDKASDSNLSHMAHAITNLLFIVWMLKNKPSFDDRGSNDQSSKA